MKFLRVVLACVMLVCVLAGVAADAGSTKEFKRETGTTKRPLPPSLTASPVSQQERPICNERYIFTTEDDDQLCLTQNSNTTVILDSIQTPTNDSQVWIARCSAEGIYYLLNAYSGSRLIAVNETSVAVARHGSYDEWEVYPETFPFEGYSAILLINATSPLRPVLTVDTSTREVFLVPTFSGEDTQLWAYRQPISPPPPPPPISPPPPPPISPAPSPSQPEQLVDGERYIFITRADDQLCLAQRNDTTVGIQSIESPTNDYQVWIPRRRAQGIFNLFNAYSGSRLIAVDENSVAIARDGSYDDSVWEVYPEPSFEGYNAILLINAATSGARPVLTADTHTGEVFLLGTFLVDDAKLWAYRRAPTTPSHQLDKHSISSGRKYYHDFM